MSRTDGSTYKSREARSANILPKSLEVRYHATMDGAKFDGKPRIEEAEIASIQWYEHPSFGEAPSLIDYTQDLILGC